MGVRAFKLKETSLHRLHELTHVSSHITPFSYQVKLFYQTVHQYNFSSISKVAHTIKAIKSYFTTEAELCQISLKLPFLFSF